MRLAHAALLVLICTGCFRPGIFPARAVPYGLAPDEPVVLGGAAANLLPPAAERPDRSIRPSFFAGAAGGVSHGGALYGGVSWLGLQHADSRAALPSFELAGAWTLLDSSRFVIDAGGTAALGLDTLRSEPTPQPLAPIAPLSANLGIGGYARGTLRTTDWLALELLALTSWQSLSAGAGARVQLGAFSLGAQVQVPVAFRSEAGPALLVELGWSVPGRTEDPDVVKWLRTE